MAVSEPKVRAIFQCVVTNLWDIGTNIPIAEDCSLGWILKSFGKRLTPLLMKVLSLGKTRTISIHPTDISPVINYYENIQSRRVVSDVEPGYLRKLLPSAAPEDGEPWADIQKDIDTKIMPGLTHWYSLGFFHCHPRKLKLNRPKAVSQFHGMYPGVPFFSSSICCKFENVDALMKYFIIIHTNRLTEIRPSSRLPRPFHQC